MKGSTLELSGIEVRRSRRTILNIDNLKIPSGQFVGLIGPNGAGKTTLLNVCCGLISPRRGFIKFNNTDLSLLMSWKKSNLRKQIGYIPQATEYNAELPFTLQEVAAMGRISVKPLLSRLNREDYERIDYWIDKLGLTSRRNQTFRSLSCGEQQKALIVRAMVQDPAILMLDEPGSNLDFNWKYQISSIIDRLYQQTHIIVLMVSHETDLLPPCCNRIVLMHEGQILADDTAEKVFASDALERAYECRIETFNISGRKYIISKKQV